MRCSTCGETLEPGATRCPTCGAAVSVGAHIPTSVRRCPRCGYQGDGIPYFKRPSHIALLIGFSLFTYGLAGLGYWLFRRNRVICPNCGLAWHMYQQALPPAPEGKRPVPMVAENSPPLPRGGLFRRIFGVGLILLATILVVIGFAEAEAVLVGVGSAIGATGTGSFWWGLRGLNERRKALMQRLQQQVLRLATHRGGTLTVTEVAADMNLSLPAAEKILLSMDDGFRVRSEITKDGVLYYEFPEVVHRKELEPGTSD
jgi:ribosomal protein S27AE